MPQCECAVLRTHAIIKSIVMHLYERSGDSLKILTGGRDCSTTMPLLYTIITGDVECGRVFVQSIDIPVSPNIYNINIV